MMNSKILCIGYVTIPVLVQAGVPTFDGWNTTRLLHDRNVQTCLINLPSPEEAGNSYIQQLDKHSTPFLRHAPFAPVSGRKWLPLDVMG